MEHIDPAVTELNRLVRAAKLFIGDDATYIEEIHMPILGLVADAPYLLRTNAMSGYIRQEYKRIVKVMKLHKEKGNDSD